MEGHGRHFTVAIAPATTVMEFAKIAAEIGQINEAVEVFLEDAEDPLPGNLALLKHLSARFAPLHVARPHFIKTTVEYNARKVDRLFRPSATIARIIEWSIGKDGLNLEGGAADYQLKYKGQVLSPDQKSRIDRSWAKGDRTRPRVQGQTAGLSNDTTRRGSSAPRPESLPFRIGERRGKWALRGTKFPFVLFFIAAAPVSGGPAGFLLRSECSGYSGAAPTSQLWHGGSDSPLPVANRPRTSQGVMEAFKDWQQCLYHPIDRIARQHNNWERDFPEKLWTPEKEITFLLETVYDLVHSSEYVGASFPTEALNVPASFVDVHLERAS